MTYENQNSSVVLTSDPSVINLPYYDAIADCIIRLDQSGILQNLNGNCIAACEIISSMLIQSDIDCVIVECQVTIQKKNEYGNTEFSLIGFDHLSFSGQVDTHTVVITKTQTPILIDISISNSLGQEHPCVVEKVDNVDPNVLANYHFNDVKVLYQPKRNVRLPHIHQRSLIERFQQETSYQDKMKKITVILGVCLVITALNLVFNGTLLFLKVF
jgi:hypothetical protein